MHPARSSPGRCRGRLRPRPKSRLPLGKPLASLAIGSIVAAVQSFLLEVCVGQLMKEDHDPFVMLSFFKHNVVQHNPNTLVRRNAATRPGGLPAPPKSPFQNGQLALCPEELEDLTRQFRDYAQSPREVTRNRPLPAHRAHCASPYAAGLRRVAPRAPQQRQRTRSRHPAPTSPSTPTGDPLPPAASLNVRQSATIPARHSAPGRPKLHPCRGAP